MDTIGVKGMDVSRLSPGRIFFGRAVDPAGCRALGRATLIVWLALAAFLGYEGLYATETGAELRGYVWGISTDLADRIGGINRHPDTFQVAPPENNIEVPVRVHVDDSRVEYTTNEVIRQEHTPAE